MGGLAKRRRDCNSAQAQPPFSAQAGSLTQDQVSPFAARAEDEGKIVPKDPFIREKFTREHTAARKLAEECFAR
jgi:hypothetical protein